MDGMMLTEKTVTTEIAADRSGSNRYPRWRWGLIAASLGLVTGCSQGGEGDRMAQTIQQDVIRQGGISLKTVACPQHLKLQPGETVECTGELDTGYVFTIPVKWKDDKGSFTWEVPNAKGLLNLTKFETLVQEGVKGEIGAAVVRCGTTLYRAVRAGEKFDCQVAVKPGAKPAPSPETKPAGEEGAIAQDAPPPASKPDKIAVSIDADRNVSWQRLIGGEPPKPAPGAAANPATQAASDSKPGTAPGSEPKLAPEAAPAGGSEKSAAPAKDSAEEFLNQPGASGKFED